MTDRNVLIAEVGELFDKIEQMLHLSHGQFLCMYYVTVSPHHTQSSSNYLHTDIITFFIVSKETLYNSTIHTGGTNIDLIANSALDSPGHFILITKTQLRSNCPRYLA